VITGIPSTPITVQQVADSLSQKYALLRKQQIENDAFYPRSINMQEFYRGQQLQMLPQLAGQIDQYVMSFDFGVSLLVAGVDDSGAHLYSIGNPGASVNDHQPIGYHSIGSGWLHAMQSMIGFGHMSARGLKETIFTVYASKRRAEVAPGVGRDTDMTIVLADGIKRLDRTMLDDLEKIFQEYQKPVSQEVKDGINKLFGEK
jgi:hypothetical protein